MKFIYLLLLMVALDCKSTDKKVVIPPPAKKNTNGCLSGNCVDGWGTKDFSDGSKYIGNFANSLPHGDGRFQYTNGEVYSGEFENGKPHGYGTLYAADKSVLYTGNWKEGKKE